MSDLQKQLLTMVDKMPAFSDSVTKVLSLTSNINCAPKDLIQVIDHDPVMTIKILKMVNSAYFGLSKEIVSIKQGVVFLGINTLKNLAITIASIGMLPDRSSKLFDNHQFLLHSLGTATISQLLSQRLGVESRDSTDYFVAGLLHDFGKVVLMQFMPEKMEKALQRAELEQIPLFEAEMAEIGSHHAELGGMLGVKWQLPSELVTSMREHHEPVTTGKSALMRDCVIAANLLVKRYEFGASGSSFIGELPEPVVERFGMNLDELQKVVGDISEHLEKVRSFA